MNGEEKNKRLYDSESDDTNQDSDSTIPIGIENKGQELRCNLLKRKKKMIKDSHMVRKHEEDYNKKFFSSITHYTKSELIGVFKNKLANCLQNQQKNKLKSFFAEIDDTFNMFTSEIIKKLDENTDLNIDTDEVMNAFGTSKEIKKLNIKDNTTSVNLRPTSSKVSHKEKNTKTRSPSDIDLIKLKKKEPKSSFSVSLQGSESECHSSWEDGISDETADTMSIDEENTKSKDRKKKKRKVDYKKKSKVPDDEKQKMYTKKLRGKKYDLYEHTSGKKMKKKSEYSDISEIENQEEGSKYQITEKKFGSVNNSELQYSVSGVNQLGVKNENYTSENNICIFEDEKINESITHVNDENSLFSNSENVELTNIFEGKNKNPLKMFDTGHVCSQISGGNRLQTEYSFNTLNNGAVIVKQCFLERQKELNGKTTNSNIDNTNVDTFSEQNKMYEIQSIDSTMLDINEYSQSGEQHSHELWNSKIITTEYNHPSIVDYTIYENYNPSYNGENYGNFNSMDSEEFTTSETLMPVQVGNVFEFLASNNTDNDDSKCSKNEVSNENKTFIIPNDQDKIAKNRSNKLNYNRNEKLYQQYFQRCNQNLNKYSMIDSILSNMNEVHRDIPETVKSASQENLLDTDKENDYMILIPLRDRTYLKIGNGSDIYITSDDYIAYFASNIKCIVHMAIYPTNLDGEENRGIRHCFYLYEDSTMKEFWFVPYDSSNNDNAADIGRYTFINMNDFGTNEVNIVSSGSSDFSIETYLANEIECIISILFLEMKSVMEEIRKGMPDSCIETDENVISFDHLVSNAECVNSNGDDLNSNINLENNGNSSIEYEKMENANTEKPGVMLKGNTTLVNDITAKMFTTINIREMIIRYLLSKANNKTLLNPSMIGNVESVSRPGPLVIMLSNHQCTEVDKRTIFANGICSDGNSVTSSGVDCLPYSSHLFKLFREILKSIHRQSTLNKSGPRTTTLTTANKNVFKIDFSKRENSSSKICYIKPHIREDLNNPRLNVVYDVVNYGTDSFLESSNDEMNNDVVRLNNSDETSYSDIMRLDASDET